MTNPRPTRVAIVGAGPAALAAALDLTKTEALRRQFCVTIYEQGYRAGGKCSGLRRPPFHTIEQNGTHYLFGCYDNAFDLARTAYDELQSTGVQGFGSFEAQFLPRHRIVFRQHFGGLWHDWSIELPPNGLTPGLGEGSLDFLSSRHIAMGVTYLLSIGLDQLAHVTRQPRLAASDHARSLQTALERILSLLPRGRPSSPAGLRAQVGLLRKWRDVSYRALHGYLGTSLLVYRAWVLFDLAASCLIGLLADDIQSPDDLERLNDVDLRDWLAGHGASQETLESAPLRGWYDAVAAYTDGDPSKPNIAAGVSLNALGRALLTYRGALFYSLRSEVADGFIAPLCAALTARGVRFAYFHRLWQVLPSHSADRIAALEFERQAVPKNGDPFSYDPFVQVAGRWCWPAEARQEQLASPAPPDLASFYAPRRGPTVQLEHDRDFDLVVLAIPLPTASAYCARVLDQKVSWRRALAALSSVETQSLRLYLDKSPEALGWRGKPGILSAFLAPFSTWEDNSHTLENQSWPVSLLPQTIASLFGVLRSESSSPGPEDAGYEMRRLADVRREALGFLTKHGCELWPGAREIDSASSFDFACLIDPEKRSGAERLQAQYLRANVGPAERYTTARAGSLRDRLRPDASGYENLFLAGDWTAAGTGTGSVEGAVLSGRVAARAIIERHWHRT